MVAAGKFNKRRVLIAPLDWGLGHATRCIPVIKAFQARGWEVLIAAEGAVEHMLRKEFPLLQFLSLAGYRVKYSRSRWTLGINLALQAPRLMRLIRKEQAWLQDAILRHDINLVISDNRFGLYTDKIPCIFLTHQLQIKAPFRWMEKMLKDLNYKYISRYTECWVPDAEVNSLAGELSHPSELHPFPLRFIGPLSRFRKQMAALRYKYAFILSGPEPQRSLLEKKILAGITTLQGNILLVRGKPGSNEKLDLPANITVHNHMEGADLEKALNSAEFIISRPGYTTVMEIAALQKPSLMIPTPGQTEQEYLGRYLMRRGLVYCVRQEKFSLPSSITQAVAFPFTPFAVTPNMFDVVLDDFLHRYFITEARDSFAVQ